LRLKNCGWPVFAPRKPNFNGISVASHRNTNDSCKQHHAAEAGKMDVFALDDDLAALEAAVAADAARRDGGLLLALSWHLRERDTRRSLALADEAEVALAPLPAPHRARPFLRLRLIRAYSRWLFADLDQAAEGVDAVLADEAADDVLRADAHWLRAWVAGDKGDSAQLQSHLQRSADCARAAGDLLRADIADAGRVRMEVLRDQAAAEKRWSELFGDRFATLPDDLHPVLAAWVNDYLGMAAFQRSDFGRAAACFILTYEHGLASGQIRRAVIAATNVGNAFTSLNEHHLALEWVQRGLDRARQTGWPNGVGSSLMQTAETLRHLGQLDAAQKLLHEALEILAPMRGSRSYAIALCYLGDLALDRKANDTALETFRLLEERAEALLQPDFTAMARRGQAHALSHLGRKQEAQAMAQAALTLSRELNDAHGTIDTLKVLAQIHARQPGGEGGALAYLNEALQLAGTIDGYTVPGDLYEAIAREHAAGGDFARAYETALLASAAREKTHSKEATNRAVAMQVRYQTERARTEGEHHRELAAAEARRAEVLAQTSATLAHLSAVGQEITAHLDVNAVFDALQRHVHGLLDAYVFQIFMLDDSGRQLSRVYGMEAGQALPRSQFGIDHPTAVSAQCVRERREILLNLKPDSCTANLIPGTRFTQTVLFSPIMVGERILGVMSVQALPPDAYGEREQLIVRTLCAYGAIALDNAHAYRRLEAALRTLKDTEAELLDKNLELEHAYRTLEEVSLTDPLTGLRNRRFLFQHLEADVAMSLRRYDDEMKSPGADPDGTPGRDLVFFMVDLDHFKEVNDKYGHAAGDLVLMQMCERLREVFRESDYLVRWGGEEFLVVARGTHRSEARYVAERVRNAVAGREFALADGQRLAATCSVGYACFPFFPAHPRLLPWPQVVELADQGLYMAKHGGRNAWVGLSGAVAGNPDGVFQRIMQDTRGAGARHEVLLETAAPAPILNGQN
jgi:diguanylate cyclase (GGDEF)-like protein